MKLGLKLGLDTYKKRIASTIPGLLDQYPDAEGAYSLRYLTTGYTGDVVLVRRSSDNAEEGFTPTEITDGTLTTWVGANNGLVKTWYDQTGNGNHLTQTTDANQPQIVNSGILITRNSLPAIKAVDATDRLIGPDTFTAEEGLSVFTVFGNDSTSGGNKGIFGKWGGSSNEYILAARDSISPTDIVFITNDSGSTKTSTGYVLNSYQDNLFTVIVDGSNQEVFRNGSSIGDDNIGGVTASDGDFSLFSYNSGANLADLNSYVQELILYKSDESSNRSAIESLIYNYYAGYDNFEDETKAVLDYADTQDYTKPDIKSAIALDACISGLKTNGVWDKLDILYVFATSGDRDFAKINLKNPGTFNCTEAGSPTFATSQGFDAGLNSANYLTTGYNPSTNGINIGLNDVSIFSWQYNTMSTDAVSKASIGCGSTTSNGLRLLPMRSTDAGVQYYTNSSTGVDTSQGNGAGLLHADRSESGSHQVFFNAASIDSEADSSISVPNETVYILGSNIAGTNTDPVNDIISIAGIGSSLEDEASDLHSTFNTYMSSL